MLIDKNTEMVEIKLQILTFKTEGPDQNIVVSLSDGDNKCTGIVDKNCHHLFGNKIARLTVITVQSYHLKKQKDNAELVIN